LKHSAERDDEAIAKSLRLVEIALTHVQVDPDKIMGLVRLIVATPRTRQCLVKGIQEFPDMSPGDMLAAVMEVLGAFVLCDQISRENPGIEQDQLYAMSSAIVADCYGVKSIRPPDAVAPDDPEADEDGSDFSN
jgi:hypothetical protein